MRGMGSVLPHFRHRAHDFAGAIAEDLSQGTQRPVLQRDNSGRIRNFRHVHRKQLKRQMFAKPQHRRWKHCDELTRGQQVMMQRQGERKDCGVGSVTPSPRNVCAMLIAGMLSAGGSIQCSSRRSANFNLRRPTRWLSAPAIATKRSSNRVSTLTSGSFTAGRSASPPARRSAGATRGRAASRRRPGLWNVRRGYCRVSLSTTADTNPPPVSRCFRCAARRLRVVKESSSLTP